MKLCTKTAIFTPTNNDKHWGGQGQYSQVHITQLQHAGVRLLVALLGTAPSLMLSKVNLSHPSQSQKEWEPHLSVI